MRSNDVSSQVARLATPGSFADPQVVSAARARLDAYEAAKQAGKAAPDLEAKRLRVLTHAQSQSSRVRHLMQAAMAPRMSANLQTEAWRANLAALNRHVGAASNWPKARQEAAAARAWTEQLQDSPSIRAWVLGLDSALAARDRGDLAGFYCGLGILWHAAAGAGDAHTEAWARGMARRWLTHDLQSPTHLQALTDQAHELLLPAPNPLWALVHELAQEDQHAAFLSRALDTNLPSLQPTVLQTGARLSRAQALQAMGQRRWDVSGWTWYADQDLFCLQAPGHAENVPHVYEMNQTDVQAVLGHLQNLADGRWQILGMSCDPTRDKLHFLVRTDADTVRSYRFIQSTDPLEALAMIERRGGQICGYAQRPSKFLGHEHLFVVDEAVQQPMEHRLETRVEVSSLAKRIPEFAANDWRIGGVAHECNRHVDLILKRPLAADAMTPAQRMRDSSVRAAVSRVQDALVARDIPRAQTALETLASQPANLSLWTRHARALSEALDLLADQPWGAAVHLADLAQHAQQPLTERSKPFAAALAQLVQTTLATELKAMRIARLCEDASHTPLQGASEAWLMHCLARAAARESVPLEANSPSTLLLYLVNNAAIGASTVLMALGADADAAIELADGSSLTARRLAEQSGIPALCEALLGNVDAAAEWARLGAVQRRAIVQVGKAAYELSQAATPTLVQRLHKLGWDDSDILAMRRYVTRTAPLWINFRPEASNRLLGDVVYRPSGKGRGRCAGNFEAAGENRVIYSWLNAVDSVDGFRSFGYAALELQNKLRARATLMLRSDSEMFRHVGTFHCMDHVLVRMNDATLEAMHAAATKSTYKRPFSVTDHSAVHFMEVHIHGPLLLSTDARAIRARFGTVDSPAALRKLQSFAALNRLPLEWHSYSHLEGSEARELPDIATASGVDVAAWAGQGAGRTLVVHPPTLAVPANYVYALHSEGFGKARKLVELLGRQGMDIVGLRVEADSNQVAQRDRRRIELLARRNVADSTPRTYKWQQTFLLHERLLEMEANRWEVVAYQQGIAAGQSTPEHFFVARATEAAMVHQLNFLNASEPLTLRRKVNDELDAQALGGNRLAGLHLGAEAATLVFKMPQTATPATEFEGPTTLLGEPIAAVPEALRFTSQAGRVYDIDELVALIADKGEFLDELRQPLPAVDVRGIILHPSGAGRRLATLRADTEALQRQICPATRAQIRAVVNALRADATDGTLPQTTLALDAFRQHLSSTASADEQVALQGAQFTCTDTHGAAFTLTVMDAMAGLQNRTGCSRATADYLTQMVQTMERA